MLDKDHDGSIGKEELVEYFKHVLPQRDLEEQFYRCDTNMSGRINLQEFL